MNKGIVAAGHPKTAEAAAVILKAGGNAFDAAIAAMHTACVVEPALASLGGGGFLMAVPNDSTPILFDFFVQTPSRRKNLDAIDSRSFLCDFGSTQQEFIIGCGTSAVPGYVKGIFEIAKRYSSMPMKELVQPALQMLKEGIEVTEMQAHIFRILTPIYLAETSREIFESTRSPGFTVETGETMFFPNYNDFLESLAIEGDDLFYRGEIAKAVNCISQSGGVVTYEDMANYQVELRKPLEVDYGNYSVLLNPAPSNGGILIALGLSRLNRKKLGQFQPGSSQHLSEVLNTIAACSTLNGEDSSSTADFDTDLYELYKQNLLNHAQANRGTTQISIIDRHRNAASVSVSNGEGCGTMIPGTSIMLNNMLGEHDVNPGGLTGWPPNSRLSSMMSPSIARASGNRLIAIGSGGSNRIPSAIQQVLVNLIDFRMSVEDAVRAPRVHFHQNEAFVEDIFESSELESVLQAFDTITRFNKRDVFFGGVHTAKHADSEVAGFGDDRRGGISIAV